MLDEKLYFIHNMVQIFLGVYCLLLSNLKRREGQKWSWSFLQFEEPRSPVFAGVCYQKFVDYNDEY